MVSAVGSIACFNEAERERQSIQRLAEIVAAMGSADTTAEKLTDISDELFTLANMKLRRLGSFFSMVVNQQQRANINEFFNQSLGFLCSNLSAEDMPRKLAIGRFFIVLWLWPHKEY